MKLPKGKLSGMTGGGTGVLGTVLEDLRVKRLTGYLKLTVMREGVEANGIVVIMEGRPVLAIRAGKERRFGPEAVRNIMEDSAVPAAVIKTYIFPPEFGTELDDFVASFSQARVESSHFEKGHRQVPAPPQQESPDDAANFFRRLSEEGLINRDMFELGFPEVDDELKKALDIFHEFMGPPKEARRPAPAQPPGKPSESEIRQKEAELSRFEEDMQKEIRKRLQEREDIKKEEESFLKMDELISGLVKKREEELRGKEETLSQKEQELTTEANKRYSDLESREAALKGEVERLRGERNDLKKKEEKLIEMERMFRKVLINSEDRLKRKEEELLRRDEEMKNELERRRKELESMKVREDEVRRKEEYLSKTFDGLDRDKLKELSSLVEREKRLREMEVVLKRREEELSAELARLRGEQKAHSERIAELERKERELARTRGMDEEVKSILSVLDELLEKLPEEVITKFASSSSFEQYEKVMKRVKGE